MKYYVIAGEASGDLHGSNLIKHLHTIDPKAEIRAWGGDLMEAAGCTLVKHYKDLAFMGFVEVLKNIRTILGNISFCKKDILAFNPDAIIYIDYPGFNLRISKWARPKGFKNYHYISPTVWAWKEGRVKQIKRDIDRMYCILPFEKAFYAKHNYEVEYVGNPLLDAIKAYEPRELDISRDKKIVALLPGSRKQEIRRMLPVMLELLHGRPDYRFVIAGAPSIDVEYFNQFIPKALEDQVAIVQNRTYDLLSISHSAIVTSGTATLETALFNVPQVVCYAGNKISFAIARKIVNVKYISLVNLILDKPSILELIQEDLTPAALEKEFTGITTGKRRDAILEDYQVLFKLLGRDGASKMVAESIYNLTKKTDEKSY